jgi:two-component system, NtrC family, response regulator
LNPTEFCDYRQKRIHRTQIPIERKGIVGESRVIMDCLDKVAKAAKNHIPVLITGETGTGKELFSRAIHANSARSPFPFVVVDCAALPDHLVESTLFGHTKGAFTGANTDQTGLMKMADKGTLFLDEVGELPPGIQKNFLRAIQEKQFRPIGAEHEVKSDFRLICATHRNLQKMVTENSFREDLYFRIFSMHIHLPPMQDRKQDIALLVQSHLSRKHDTPAEKKCIVSEDFLVELQSYDWPGNVRELFNTLDLVCSDAGAGATLFAHHLPAHIRAFHIRNKFTPPAPASADTKTVERLLPFKDYMENMKLAYLQDLLAATRGDISVCCKRSGLSRSQVYRLMQQYDLKKS